MIAYLVNQILLGKLTYQTVVTKRPDLKEQIDLYILENDLENSIDKSI